MSEKADKKTAAGTRETTGREHSTEKTRELLLEAGKKLFALHGLEGATVKDISDAAGVNVSLVSYHFQGKEGLYRSCIQQFGTTRLQVAQRLLQPVRSREEFRVRMQMFADEVLTSFNAEPELTQIIHREIESGLPIAKDIFQDTIFRVFTTLIDFIEDSVKQGFLRKGLDPRLTASIIFGSISHIARSDRLNCDMYNQTIADPAYRERVIDEMLTVFLDGILPE